MGMNGQREASLSSPAAWEGGRKRLSEKVSHCLSVPNPSYWWLAYQEQ